MPYPVLPGAVQFTIMNRTKRRVERANVVYIGQLVPITDNREIRADAFDELANKLSAVKKIGKTSEKNFKARKSSLGDIKIARFETELRGTKSPFRFAVSGWWKTGAQTSEIETEIQRDILGSGICINGEWYLDNPSNSFIVRVARLIKRHYGFAMNTEDPHYVGSTTQDEIATIIKEDEKETEEIEKTSNEIVGFSIDGKVYKHKGGRATYAALFKKLHSLDARVINKIYKERRGLLAREPRAFDHQYAGTERWSKRVIKNTSAVGGGWYVNKKLAIPRMREIVRFVSKISGKKIVLLSK